MDKYQTIIDTLKKMGVNRDWNLALIAVYICPQGDSVPQAFKGLWVECNEDLKTYISKIPESVNPEIARSPGYAELVKALNSDLWPSIRKMFPDVYRADSPSGSVLLMQESGSSISIPSGFRGDITQIAVVHERNPGLFNPDLITDTGIRVMGRWAVMNSDCCQEFNEDDVLLWLNGTYRVYRYDGVVAFEEYQR